MTPLLWFALGATTQAAASLCAYALGRRHGRLAMVARFTALRDLCIASGTAPEPMTSRPHDAP